MEEKSASPKKRPSSPPTAVPKLNKIMAWYLDINSREGQFYEDKNHPCFLSFKLDLLCDFVGSGRELGF
jgi:hypothetical protein